VLSHLSVHSSLALRELLLLVGVDPQVERPPAEALLLARVALLDSLLQQQLPLDQPQA